MKIDWRDLRPTDELRDAVEACIEPSHDLAGETLVLSQDGAEYEAHIPARAPERPVALRVRGDDLIELAARAAGLLRTLAYHHRSGGR